MLTNEQENLLRHLSYFSILDKDGCLLFLSKSDRHKPEYGLRTLKRWGYVNQRKDGLYSISAKGLAHHNRAATRLTCGGNAQARQRLAATSHVAALMARQGIYPVDTIPPKGAAVFILSQIWRTIREGVTSTASFHGMLFLNGQRLVIYHIGDGNFDWQIFAERSLFFQHYGRYDDRADGMLLICEDGKGPEIANGIIRSTLYRRRRLLRNETAFYETDKPQKYAKAPIRMHEQYSRAFFTEEKDLPVTLAAIVDREKTVELFRDHIDGVRASGKHFWDVEKGTRRYIINPQNDLLKFLRLFSCLKDADSALQTRWHLFHWKKYAELSKPYESRIEVRTV